MCILFEPPIHIISHEHTYLYSPPHFPHSTDPPIPTCPGLNDLYLATQKNPGTETKLPQQLEQELEIQKSIRQEKETALQLLEKSTHEKKDAIVALWDTKSANLKVWTQAQQGPSEDMQSGGEAGLAHSQQQEDGEGAP